MWWAVTKRRHILRESFGRGKFSFLSYHESNLSLIALEAMPLLGNHQFIPFLIEPKGTSLEQNCYERS